jgi:hypothetical protein
MFLTYFYRIKESLIKDYYDRSLEPTINLFYESIDYKTKQLHFLTWITIVRYLCPRTGGVCL